MIRLYSNLGMKMVTVDKYIWNTPMQLILQKSLALNPRIIGV